MKNSENIKVLLGQRVRTLRTQAGLSQEGFAEKCGLDRTYISGIERGIRNPTLEILYILATALHTELTTLFTFDESD
ncbi:MULTISPECIES: helix-turn-helix domain-containing protein [Kosakonia]|jgi:transcriptional regulator with XRE-family HTH domain|uniref:Helix-turn-helix transcriptional regulator n=1 Tax=Kosakonia sacchari TaxID=1158459 RepID=A0ABZ0MSW9_9ENTR|nr:MULTISPECIES: helix-turn-helix transcriptional regulator [Kosakonia]WOZ78626.1 helix-turn-helix transcriptional regulator [Kosakonia sacchari]